ncbi:unnamed protein product [Calicophoron daubneyi]|uniref:Calpain-B n=1 Tax=Calicophoron daubneyi TaxID=300641 RepID=A0AAV2TSW7_CALDB
MATLIYANEPVSYHNKEDHYRMGGNETARGALRRRKELKTIMDTRVHRSKSLQASRKWFAKQVNNQLQKGNLWRDPFMPPDKTSIGPGISGDFEWLRPREFRPNAQFVLDGISRFDVKQGELGDCWLLAALSSLSVHPNLMSQVIPSGQSFDTGTSATPDRLPYCGMFWFRMWRFGYWVDVVVDDRLPTRHGHLVFMRSSDPDEFWSALFEKACAKVFGAYDMLPGGCTAEAMEDLTGGLTEVIDLQENPPRDLYDRMLNSQARASLMACSIDSQDGHIEGEGPMGLITAHAYAITDVRTLDTDYESVKLVRLRNPWGNEKEWCGAWSDQSSEWKRIPASERKRIGLTFQNDGEFWMSYEDFCRYFSRIEFCHLGPESGTFGEPLGQQLATVRWEMTKEEGEWARFSTAGGCRNYADTFHTNPQFRVQVTDPDESQNDNRGTIIVGLMQKSRRETHQEPFTIGYSIYQLEGKSAREGLLSKTFFVTHNSIARSPAFTNMREVAGRHRLPLGQYVIIPSTFEPNQEAKFILRIFSERKCTSNELDDSTNISKDEDMGFGIPTTPTSDDQLLTERLRAAFIDVAGPRECISYPELKDILDAAFTKDFNFDGFSSETARSMVSLMDTDLTGALDFHQFKRLWMDLRVWRTIFKKFDNNQTGKLDAFELRAVMKTLGIRVSNKVYQAIICRYTNRNGEIPFDDYILLVIRLVTVLETFKAQERLPDGRAVFEIEEFIRSVIYI